MLTVVCPSSLIAYVVADVERNDRNPRPMKHCRMLQGSASGTPGRWRAACLPCPYRRLADGFGKSHAFFGPWLLVSCPGSPREEPSTQQVPAFPTYRCESGFELLYHCTDCGPWNLPAPWAAVAPFPATSRLSDLITLPHCNPRKVDHKACARGHFACPSAFCVELLLSISPGSNLSSARDYLWIL